MPLLGLPVNLRGLTFDNVATSTEQHEGVPILVVEGNVVNTTRKIEDVPRLKFIVRNAAQAGNLCLDRGSRARHAAAGRGGRFPHPPCLAAGRARAISSSASSTRRDIVGAEPLISPWHAFS